jgi:hypothetical protein
MQRKRSHDLTRPMSHATAVFAWRFRKKTKFTLDSDLPSAKMRTVWGNIELPLPNHTNQPNP